MVEPTRVHRLFKWMVIPNDIGINVPKELRKRIRLHSEISQNEKEKISQSRLEINRKVDIDEGMKSDQTQNFKCSS